ncbi:MAG TPA: serine hydrolase domain-containing protein [Streptosporangiaceae bacterium]|nr:serine hydrolase domain-containing protein [Streptosporangiaceae bacterium]
MSGVDGFSGVVLIQRGDKNLLAIGGMAGPGPDAACTVDTRFQIASVSKQFTATAVLLLAERGALSVRDPVRRWLPSCPAAWDQITVHHLLTHTAGLVHWRQLPGLDLTTRISTAELLGVLRDMPLLFPPGYRHFYSSPGYVLLASIVEQASGEPYAGFLAREVFGPLGMSATFAGDPQGQPDLAAGHHAGSPVPSWELGTSNKGTGDVWSTVADMARWNQAVDSGRILTAGSQQAMFTSHVEISEDQGPFHSFGYGYGWFLGAATGGHRVVYHPGDNPGFVAFNAWFPGQDTRLVVLSNDETTDLPAILRQAVGLAHLS